MPELPEVETICRQLQSSIAGKTIKSTQVLYPKVVHGMGVVNFVRALVGKKVRRVGRQGKLILIQLSGDETLVVHLKMTGRLLLSGEPTKSTEVIFTLTNGLVLRYDDLRRFGYMKVVPTSKEAKLVYKEEMGIDFFSPQLTVDRFKELIKSRGGSQIKPLLLDQSLIAGVGNIYAQESCFAAKIHPLRKVSSLSERELADLYKALYTIMKKAITKGGTTADDYRDAYGNSGQFARYLKVYSRASKSCLRCRTKLTKKNIGGRGTVFCPKCQV